VTLYHVVWQLLGVVAALQCSLLRVACYISNSSPFCVCSRTLYHVQGVHTHARQPGPPITNIAPLSYAASVLLLLLLLLLLLQSRASPGQAPW
jgi:hypothetical protein